MSILLAVEDVPPTTIEVAGASSLTGVGAAVLSSLLTLTAVGAAAPALSGSALLAAAITLTQVSGAETSASGWFTSVADLTLFQVGPKSELRTGAALVRVRPLPLPVVVPPPSGTPPQLFVRPGGVPIIVAATIEELEAPPPATPSLQVQAGAPPVLSGFMTVTVTPAPLPPEIRAKSTPPTIAGAVRTKKSE